MTLEEKVAPMLSIWSAKSAITDDHGRFDTSDPPEWFRVGIGRIERSSDRHHVVEDLGEAARKGLAATVDIELPDVETYHTLVEQVRNGAVSETAIDEAVRRLLYAKFIVGLFEDPFVDPDEAAGISGSAEARPLAIPELVEDVPAIIEGWYVGQETGTAIAEVLMGDYNPSGRLPVTIPRSHVTRPVKELKGFVRITLNPGETRTVSFTRLRRAVLPWPRHAARRRAGHVRHHGRPELCRPENHCARSNPVGSPRSLNPTTTPDR